MFEFSIGQVEGTVLQQIKQQNLESQRRNFLYPHWENNAIETIAFPSRSMYIIDSNQYAIELVTYLLVLVVYFYELHAFGKKCF